MFVSRRIPGTFGCSLFSRSNATSSRSSCSSGVTISPFQGRKTGISRHFFTRSPSASKNRAVEPSRGRLTATGEWRLQQRLSARKSQGDENESAWTNLGLILLCTATTTNYNTPSRQEEGVWQDFPASPAKRDRRRFVRCRPRMHGGEAGRADLPGGFKAGGRLAHVDANEPGFAQWDGGEVRSLPVEKCRQAYWAAPINARMSSAAWIVKTNRPDSDL